MDRTVTNVTTVSSWPWAGHARWHASPGAPGELQARLGEFAALIRRLNRWLCSRGLALVHFLDSVANLGVVGQLSVAMGGVQVGDLLLPGIAVEVDQLVLTEVEVRVAVRPGAVSAACPGCRRRSSRVHCYY